MTFVISLSSEGIDWSIYLPRHDGVIKCMETFSALLAVCAGNSPVTGEFPAQRPVTRSFNIFFDLRLNKRLSKQWWGWWFETPSRSSWRHCHGIGNSTWHWSIPGLRPIGAMASATIVSTSTSVISQTIIPTRQCHGNFVSRHVCNQRQAINDLIKWQVTWKYRWQNRSRFVQGSMS